CPLTPQRAEEPERGQGRQPQDDRQPEGRRPAATIDEMAGRDRGEGHARVEERVDEPKPRAAALRRQHLTGQGYHARRWRHEDPDESAPECDGTAERERASRGRRPDEPGHDHRVTASYAIEQRASEDRRNTEERGPAYDEVCPRGIEAALHEELRPKSSAVG